MSEEIKPCPFCGDKDIELFPNYGRYFAACCVCGSEGPNKERKEEAIKAWNQRPYDYDMPAIVKKVKELEAENKKIEDALQVYADRANWSMEARFEYETGNLLATGDCETDEGSVCLDGDLYWLGYGNDGYELAEKILGELKPCKQPE